MRLVARFAAVFFVVMCGALVLATWFASKREVRRSEVHIGADVLALADVLETSILLAEEHGVAGAAKDVVAAASRRSISLEARFFAEGEPVPPENPVFHVVRHRREIVAHGRRLGTLEIVHDVPSQTAIAERALKEELVFVVPLGVVTAAVALVLGHLFIGRPLGRVVAQARRIANEDFTARLKEDRTDEIGFLKRELNVMCEKIERAQTRQKEEATAHVETLEKLRHLDRLKTVGTLASAVAHELGTPFNVVLLRAESLLHEAADEQERRDAARVIVAQIDKMSAIVRQLLDFSRASPAEKERSDLAAVLREVERLLGPLAKKHGVALRAEPGEELSAEVDRLRLEQLVTNLVMNAIAATAAGHAVVLRLDRVERAKRPASGEVVAAARIDVVDEGHGMDEAHLGRIFEPFYTTKAAGHGTGLGLNVAMGIAEEHGGWLSAVSEPGRGSTFSVYLPLEP